MKTNKLPDFLSAVQIDVLLLGVEHKLSRSSMGWSYDDGERPLRIYRPATIKSLHKYGLLDANFDDARGFGCCDEATLVQNLDGAHFVHSPGVPELFVWTNRRGVELLQKIQRDTGLLPTFGTALQ